MNPNPLCCNYINLLNNIIEYYYTFEPDYDEFANKYTHYNIPMPPPPPLFSNNPLTDDSYCYNPFDNLKALLQNRNSSPEYVDNLLSEIRQDPNFNSNFIDYLLSEINQDPSSKQNLDPSCNSIDYLVSELRRGPSPKQNLDPSCNSIDNLASELRLGPSLSSNSIDNLLSELRLGPSPSSNFNDDSVNDDSVNDDSVNDDVDAMDVDFNKFISQMIANPNNCNDMFSHIMEFMENDILNCNLNDDEFNEFDDVKNQNEFDDDDDDNETPTYDNIIFYSGTTQQLTKNGITKQLTTEKQKQIYFKKLQNRLAEIPELYRFEIKNPNQMTYEERLNIFKTAFTLCAEYIKLLNENDPNYDPELHKYKFDSMQLILIPLMMNFLNINNESVKNKNKSKELLIFLKKTLSDNNLNSGFIK